MSDPRDDRRNDTGSVMVVAALAMVALVLFAALALDVGFIWSSRTQSQSVADAAAIAAAQVMIVHDPMNPTYAFDQGVGEAAGIAYAAKNSTVANTSVTINGGDFDFGNWNFTTRTLEAGDPANPDSMTAVRVDVRMDGTDNSRSPGILSRILEANDGSRPFMSGFTVNNTAVAYLGFQGHFEPGFFDLPVALDSCDLAGNNGCGTDFCARTQAASTCPLERAQTNTNGIICGEFSNTADQNMCWINFSDEDPAINGPVLQDIIDNGNQEEVEAGDSTYLDNGDKTSTVDYLRDMMYGCLKGQGGGMDPPPPPMGHDEYGSGFPDSWVVKLPVVECQDEAHCAGGSPFKIVGGVCFEIREIIAPAPGKVCTLAPTTGTSRWIKGRALCPNSPDAKVKELYEEYCGVDEETEPVEPGGCGFGLRANRVVLVE